MKTEHLPKILLTGFVAALLLYVIAFGFLQSCRTTKGPWHVTFLSDASGVPGLEIKQDKLNVSKRIKFTDQTIPEKNLAREVVFNDPTQTNIPFGQVIFQDLTFLPGTVTLNLFGHEIELIPRTLTIDRQENPWKNGEEISITGERDFQPRLKK